MWYFLNERADLRQVARALGEGGDGNSPPRETLGESGQFEEVAVRPPVLEQAFQKLSVAIDVACPRGFS